MFLQNPCLVHSCKGVSLSLIDNGGNLVEMGDYCLDHIPNPKKAHDAILEYILTNEKIVGLNAIGLSFADVDISGKKFYGCNFQHCTFSKIKSTGMRARMTCFDFSVFIDCNYVESNIQFCSFGGSTISHTLFTGSELQHNNFCGIKAFQTSYDDSDLYSSRFAKAKLVNTSFQNCNIKKTVFWEIEQNNVSFRQSNSREAEFERNGSELFMSGGGLY